MTWIGRSTGRAERRQVVVLAVGFDRSEASDPEEIVDCLARRRSFVARIVARFGGTIARADHDLLIAAWGWPLASEADTRLAVAAALEIAAEPGGAARCGVDAGIAITPETDDQLAGIGVVGEMLGGAVALQQSTAIGRVAISETLRRLIGSAFEVAPSDPQAAPPGSWRVLRRTPARAANLASGTRELTGRSREITRIAACWRAAVSGPGQALCLQGDAGVGKSALISRLECIVRADGAKAIAVQCLPETQQTPLEPLRRLIETLAETVEPAACLEDAAGLDTLEKLLESATCLQPLLVVIEDLQWCDAASLAAISTLCNRIAQLTQFMLITTRRPLPGGTPADRAGLGEMVPVNRLTASEIERVLASISAGAGLGPDMRRRIAEHADGIPLYALELVRLCVEAPESEAHHRLLARPNRLNAALASRLDALASLKPLAQAAAVLGRRFDVRVLAAMLHMDARGLVERLGMLVSLGILECGEEKRPELYRFTQALLWSQAYGSVLKGRRRQLHARAAETLMTCFPKVADGYPETLAHHLKKAGDHVQAFVWWCKAAHMAAAQGTPASAVAHLTQALAAKSEAPEACDAVEEAELLALLGAQLGALRGNASRETVAAYERALELIDAMPARPAALGFDIGWGLVAIHLVRGNVREAVTMSGRLLEDAREGQRDDVLLLALRMHGTARLLSGRVKEAVELLTHASLIYEPTLHGGLRVRYVSDPGAVALAHLCSAQALSGDAEASRRTRERALELAGDIGHAHTSANVLGVLSLAAVHLDEVGIAVSLARATHAVAREHGHVYWAARAELIMAWEHGRRSPLSGLAAMREAVARYHQTGASRASVLAHCLAADVANRAGEPLVALELLEPVADAGEMHGEWIYAPEVMRLKALALARLGKSQLPQAEHFLAAAEDLARRQGTPDLAARALRDMALIGDIASAQSHAGKRRARRVPARIE